MRSDPEKWTVQVDEAGSSVGSDVQPDRHRRKPGDADQAVRRQSLDAQQPDGLDEFQRSPGRRGAARLTLDPVVKAPRKRVARKPMAQRTVADAVKSLSLSDRFLATLSVTGNPSAACRASTMTRRQLNELLEADAEFVRCYHEALEEAADMLEAEAWRRALEGVPHPIVNSGKPVLDPATGGTLMVRRYSDTLLMMLLRGSKPDKFSLKAPVAAREDPLLVLKEISTDDDPPRREPSARTARDGAASKPQA
ncbi:hypothetical protein [Lichenicoccus roseus]|uniref:Uncharacterized protein n=1 Tax=Lichenicoccus roseus TaxID=2683649 RepID=A0A5R9JAR4_9PROT|nr:hypothetical protein [Lichenicoccus roseus]TLU72691.1 hypothetical protein FE263_11705 [Lichenicoccus roseus]